jgi:hypothetical protein
MAAQVNADFETQDWLADSGANTHITVDSSNINNPQPFDGTNTVGVGNGEGLNIKHPNFCSKIYYIILMIPPIFFPLANSALTIIVSLRLLVQILL